MEVPGSTDPYFQTYSLGCRYNDFEITKDGELIMVDCAISEIMKDCGLFYTPKKIPYVRKRIVMFQIDDHGKPASYIVQIRRGKVSSIKKQF
jgi:hypothetical protein